MGDPQPSDTKEALELPTRVGLALALAFVATAALARSAATFRVVNDSSYTIEVGYHNSDGVEILRIKDLAPDQEKDFDEWRTYV